MKKISILLAFAIAAGLALSSCKKEGEKVKLVTQKDSLSYAYGVGYGTHIATNYLKGDSTGPNYNALMKGLKEGMKSSDTSLTYYAMGLSLGSTLKKDAEKGMMGDSTLTMNMEIMKSALFATIQKKQTQITADAANALLQKTVEKKQKEQAEKQFGSNKTAGEQFLAQNKTKEGIVTLPSGLQYKIIKAGNGPKPKATDKVKVNYKGTLLNGKVFDSSEGKAPIVLEVNHVIKGWTEALQLMPVGSKWELFIPQELAYGDRSQEPIPPYSALIFEVELISIEK